MIMYTNADITLYHLTDTGYVKKIIKNVFWDEVQSSNITKTGMSNADSLKIFIPVSSLKEEFAVTKGKDLVVKGISAVEIVNTSPKEQSAALKALREAHEVYTVNACDFKTYGSENMQHYALSCR